MLAAVLLAVAATVLATTFGTRPVGAAFPGENGKIVYEDLTLPAFDYEIFVMNPDGSGRTNLTNDGDADAEDRMPAVSPDGTKIAFMSDRDGDNEVFVMDSDGSDPTNITNNTVYDTAPSWSADGSKIAIQSMPDGTDSEVVVMGSDGAGPTNLTDDDTDDYDPAFSPDGRRIVFSSNRDGNQELYAMDAADGANVARLTDDPTLGFDPDWQPNTAPSVTGMRPAPRSKVRDLTPKISATVSDVQDELVGGDLRIYVDGRRRAFDYSQATDRLVHDSRRLSPGKHTVRVFAEDSSDADVTQKWSFTVIERR
jgi:dipeptidyl aminopeptidase/acylaminoacyl peptidase